MKVGLVIEGGGMKGIFSSGVLDYFMEENLSFDYCIGVSAGSANAVSFVAGQRKRCYRFFHDYGDEKEFLSLFSYIKTGQYFGLDYIYDNISSTKGKDPFDYKAFQASPCQCELVATSCLDGTARYFQKDALKENSFEVLKASCSVPCVCHPIMIDGIPYLDGGVADPIPVQRALDIGCDVVVTVLLNRFPKKPKPVKNNFFYEATIGCYPKLLNKVLKSEELHCLQGDLVLAYEKLGKTIVLMPDDDTGITSTTKDKQLLDRYYWQGYYKAQVMMPQIKKMMGLQ